MRGLGRDGFPASGGEPLQDRDWVDRRAGAGRQAQRRDDAQKRPASLPLAQRGQLVELEVVHQVGLDGSHRPNEGKTTAPGVGATAAVVPGRARPRDGRPSGGPIAPPGLPRWPPAHPAGGYIPVGQSDLGRRTPEPLLLVSDRPRARPCVSSPGNAARGGPPNRVETICQFHPSSARRRDRARNAENRRDAYPQVT